MSNAIIRPSKAGGIDGWMALVEHRATVLDFVQQASAVCAECDGKLAGALLFSNQLHMLCFLAVDPDARRQHIAEEMVSWMLAHTTPSVDVTVTTYREDQPEGAAARAFYRRMGFVPGRLTEGFGSPVQEFVLKH